MAPDFLFLAPRLVCRILFNEELRFPKKQFPELLLEDGGLTRVRLQQPLESLCGKSDVYVGGHVSASCQHMLNILKQVSAALLLVLWIAQRGKRF